MSSNPSSRHPPPENGGAAIDSSSTPIVNDTVLHTQYSGPEYHELLKYQHFLMPSYHSADDAPSDRKAKSEELRIAPLVWWDVKRHLSQCGSSLQQYAVLGHIPSPNCEVQEPVFLNTNAPWSAFLCGSQGSGKSHALSCMLENCLLTDRALVSQIGENPNPLAGLVFHYDSCQGSGVCEAAYLCSNIPTTILVSPSNYRRLKLQYEQMAKARDGSANIKVKPLCLLSEHLDTERIKTLMAYLIKIFRDMAMETKGLGPFDYRKFKQNLISKDFLEKQSGPLKMRIELLESFLDPSITLQGHSNTNRSTGTDYLKGSQGTMTIIDLTDPVVDADSACALFNICLSVFISQTECSKIVALDEAHNYMIETSTSAKDFTDKLLKTVREQRHQATRVVIATQEPTINTALIDLCNITMVHRCQSPAWFSVLKKHVGSLFLNGKSLSSEETKDDDEQNGTANADKNLFQEIMNLKLGESLLFCATAAIAVKEEEVVKMADRVVKFKTRKRITADGGTTKLASGM
ncbi:hypothetical protein CC78DRAFT_597526 [Lojkania enalia]|uniref:P-loop containing nucleoside triphosphate hydrolase n=1 Tax=Lojkania enalia TaxID=147567 RepID=A0A9P4KBE6_9PLEO|nr:hypothetical protein CC78DRAFT_597526 [Didymosphaeria enalia]